MHVEFYFPSNVLCRLSEMGQHVGIRMVDLLVLRERGFKREIKLLSVLIFIKANLWKVSSTQPVKPHDTYWYASMQHNIFTL